MRRPRPYYKASHNSWYANIGPNRRPVKLAEGQKNEKAAWEKYDLLMAGRQPLDGDWLVVDLVQKFTDWHKTNSADRTYDFYFTPLESFLGSLSPRMKVADLKPHHLTEWIETRKMAKQSKKVKGTQNEHRTVVTARPIGQNRRRNLIRAVKAAFKWAEEQEYIARSPLKNVKVPAAIPRGDDAYLMPEQWSQLIAVVKDEPMLDILTTLKETGCRPQEARAVKSKHFNRAERCWVFPQLQSKGKKQSRIVHLTDRAYQICERLALKNPDGPIFRNLKGRAWTHNAMNCRCIRLSKKLGFRVTPYAARHTFATEAILKGVDLQTIATIMGHVDLRMLSKIYQHIHRRSDFIKEGLRKATGG
jgi:integrase